MIEAIEQALGYTLSPSIRQAFLAVDRRCFVPRYYVQEGRQWVEKEAGAEIYENRAFFTRLDARGVPDSSSSQPSLMAPMLEALALMPGLRVLEIGTGTGYNAALIAEVVGKRGRVVSVDIASDLVEQATVRLAAWPWVETAGADGLLGYPERAPYDRIVATGGTPTIPVPWLQQLGVGGVLVGNLTLPLGTPTPIYCLLKQDDERLQGSLLTTPAFFMGLHHEEAHPSPRSDFVFYEAMPILEQGQTTVDFVHFLKDPGLALFVHHRLPGLEAHLRTHSHPDRSGASTLERCLLLPGRALLTFLPGPDTKGIFHVEVRGQEYLWSRLFEAYTEWEKLGRPTLDRYRLSVDQNAHVTLTLQEKNHQRSGSVH